MSCFIHQHDRDAFANWECESAGMAKHILFVATCVKLSFANMVVKCLQKVDRNMSVVFILMFI